MDLDGARNAKAEAFEKAFGYEEVPVAATFSAALSGPFFAPLDGSEAQHDLVQARRENRPRPRELIALGVLPPPGHNRNPQDHGLGVFIQQKRLIEHPIVESARRISKGECRVIYTGPAVRRSPANGSLCRPLQVGASIGHHRVSAGTLACFARKRDGGGIGMLSNNHIFADTNRGQPGDKIIQPARLDGGDGKDASCHVGSLHKFVRIDFDPGAANYVDCAFAYLLDGVETVPALLQNPDDASETWPIGALEELVFDTLPVLKVGRTTKLTRGVIEAVEVDNINVKMQLGSTARIARFDGQLAISSLERAFSKGGDSGSMIFTEDGRPVGLLFAGTSRGGLGNFGVTYANPIAAVLEALNIDIYVEM